MVSQNRVNIPPIARKNVTQRGGMAEVVFVCLFVSLILDIAVYIYRFLSSVQKYSTTTNLYIYVIYLNILMNNAYLYDVPYAWLHFLMKHVLWNEPQLVS